MKIGQDVSSKIEQKLYRKTNENKQNFKQIVQNQSNELKQEELNQLKEEITKQGEKIVRFRSFRDLAKFKRMIKQFLQETVHEGLALHESRNYHPNSYNHSLTTVQKIDEKLIQLTEEIIDQEKKAVNLLETIGEIKGLLFNLST